MTNGVKMSNQQNEVLNLQKLAYQVTSGQNPIGKQLQNSKTLDESHKLFGRGEQNNKYADFETHQ